MFSKFRHCVNTYTRDYIRSELPDYPQFNTPADIHPYLTDDYAYNEPFPCIVPVFGSMSALKDIALKQRYIQPIFICPNVTACCEIYYKLKTINTGITLNYVRAVNPATSPVSKSFTAKIELVNLYTRIKNDDIIIPPQQKTLEWMKLDPLSVKLFPWYESQGKIQDQPMPGIGPPIGATAITHEWTQGDYYSEASYKGELEHMGVVRIYGVVKIRDTGEYAIIGLTNLMPCRLITGYVGKSPGYVYLGIQEIAVANYTTKSKPITLPNGSTTTIFYDSATTSVYSQSQGKYVTVATAYSNVSISFEMATGAFSPFL